MPYIIVDSNSLPPQPFVPAPILGNTTTYFGSGFQNINKVVPGPVMAIESYPVAGNTGVNSESPYQTPPAIGSDPPTFRNNGGTVVSPPNPVQVFSSREPNDNSAGVAPGPILPPDFG